jgi:protein gp37
MSDGTDIEWTDATWQPITGCSIVSPGCTNCYAMKLAGTRLRNIPSRKGLTNASKAGPVWNGKVRLNEEWLTQPLRWKRPRKIFVCAHGDLFHENAPDEWIDKVFAVMALCPQHQFQVLTKRAERMREYFSALAADDYRLLTDGRIAERLGEIGHDVFRAVMTRDEFADKYANSINPDAGNWPLRNVWLGVSAERQQEADERIPHLLQTPAAIRFVSCEPLLGPIDLRAIPRPYDDITVAHDALEGRWHNFPDGRFPGYTLERLNWIIVGGESGPGARPMHPDWARSLRDQCEAAGVPFFFKQWGAWLPGEANRGQFDARPMHAYRRCDTHDYHWPAGRHEIQNFGSHPDRFSGDWHARRVGKKAAGRLLDGKEHNGFPG